MEAGRFPSARAVSQAEDPVRAYEEERRLGVRRLDPRATVADPAVRPGGPLPVPARGVRRGRARAQPRAPVELADQPVDRVEERLGQLGRQDVADRVLDAVGGAAPRRRRAERRRVVVAQPVGQRLEVGDPARRAERPAPRPAAGRHGGPRPSPASSIAGSLVPGGPPATAARPGSVIRAQSSPGLVPIASPSSAVGVGGASRRSGRRLRSEPLTRIRNE